MAQWKETLEPYIRVNERIRTTTIVPTAGEDLIIGATIISDSGPSYPVLVTGQREFLNIFASQDITKEYLDSLNDFYDDGTGVRSDVASTMWLNAYRLAGSTNMLIVRATKGADMNYVVPTDESSPEQYIVRDGQLLRSVQGFSLVNDRKSEFGNNLKETGWAISINEIGIIGNLVGDNGPLYEYFAADLRELVEYLNSTSKFFSPKYKFLKRGEGLNTAEFQVITNDTDTPDAVYFDEVYLAAHFIDKKGFDSTVDESQQDGYGSNNTGYPTSGENPANISPAVKEGTKSDGLAYLVALDKKIGLASQIKESNIIDLNSADYSGWNEGNNSSEFYFVNTYNSNSDIQIRIRKFNHDAVILRDDIKPTINKRGQSPYDVIEDVITQYEDATDKSKIKERDFYEVAVLDPSLDKSPLSFNVGNIPGRGDLTLSELNDTLKMINLHINSMEDLGLSYYKPSDNEPSQIQRQLGIGRKDEWDDSEWDKSTDILTVTPDDLMRSISAITEDEVYTTEGLTDLGNTDLKFQNYLCNMAKNENYFYPISTLYSTNYLAIANYRTRLAQDSHKLYTSAPWDIDSGTVGFKFRACPSVIYWEAVSKNRSMNREFASVFGFSGNGQVLYTNPVTEFTKKQRQLLLSKQVNTVMWNTQNQTWNMNDCYTMTSENHILNEDGNSRLFIRINKAIPTLLRPLIGRKLGPATYSDAEDILKYWFERTIIPMQYSVSGYRITISTLEANDDQARRQNKMYVLVECLFPRSLKYVIVYSDALDMGMEFIGEIV